MLTIITPCCRQQNITELYKSIQFDKIIKWIIVYDTSKDRKYTKLYTEHPKILEIECNKGISGNPQRNYGMSIVQDGYIYFLDDDNIIHPEFWSIVNELDNIHFYTFDQQRNNNMTILHGNNVAVNKIDTAMYIVHKKHIGNIKWIENKYNADGYFISGIYAKHRDQHFYINKTACYYNFLVPA